MYFAAGSPPILYPQIEHSMHSPLFNGFNLLENEISTEPFAFKSFTFTVAAVGAAPEMGVGAAVVAAAAHHRNGFWIVPPAGPNAAGSARPRMCLRPWAMFTAELGALAGVTSTSIQSFSGLLEMVG